MAAFVFHGYTVRHMKESDFPLVAAWTKKGDPKFWIEEQPGRQNFIVFEGKEFPLVLNGYTYTLKLPLAFFQTHHVTPSQVRLAFHASHLASPKKVLRGITMLVPLIERALSLGGARLIFFTSHSLTMVAFMEKKHGYSLQPNVDGGEDGVVMAKRIGITE